jgi:endonuclease YncB( thermonuclease family)
MTVMVIDETNSLIRKLLMLAGVIMLAACGGETLQGRVVGVLDGDTLRVSVGQHQYEVELVDSYSLPAGHAYAGLAKRGLASLALNKMVTIEVKGRPGTRQLRGRVYLAGSNLSGELIKRGYAWVSRDDAQDMDLYWMELDAKTRNVGLWSRLEQVPGR